MAKTSNVIKIIVDLVATFPPEKQQEVLNFVEFLESKLKDDFIQRTYGSCADDPITIDDEGILEELDDNLEGVFN
ncbi:MAG: DUF2281 domain-containing protein [Cyanobacteria bacterium P01_H01_bin.35]